MSAPIVRAFAASIVLSAAVAQQAPRAQQQTPSNPKLPPLFFTETWKQTLSGDFDSQRDSLLERTRALMERYPLYPQLSATPV